MMPAETSESGADPSGLAIIASKIAPEGVRRPVLTRARLVGWLEQQKNARVVLILAEAGYGKSTLLGDFARRSATPVVWYRIETSDGDWITFLSYLVAALRSVISDFGRSTEALLRHVAAMGSSRELVLSQFLADLGAVGSSQLVVILDDYHLVGESEDVRLIMGRVLERAPAGLCFVLAGRGRPNLALGRLAAQGRVSELGTMDLRFTRAEIEELFRTTYAQSLDRHSCDVVEERTQGWAASLQLVSASIAVSRTSEVSAFIDALSGTKGPIYDFLAEEVLSRMSPLTQRILVHASIIDHVTPALVAAALSTTGAATDIETVRVHLHDAQSLGLLGDGLDASAGFRIHPLFRDFLRHQLEQTIPADGVAGMHLAVAQACGPAAWLPAAKHYAIAGRPDDAMKVLGSAASEALGTGAWGPVVEVLALMPDTPPPPAVEVIRARALASDGRPDEAVQALDDIDVRELDTDDRALIKLALASALQIAGDSDRYWHAVDALATLGHSDPVVSRLGQSWALIRTACQGGSIGDARKSLMRLVAEADDENLGHFAGIAMHNAATAALAQGDFRDASILAERARVTLVGSRGDAGVWPSALAIRALAEAESGRIDEGVQLMEEAAASPQALPDVLADAAYLAAIRGDRSRARTHEHGLRRRVSSGSPEVGVVFLAEVARITTLMSDGRFGDASARARERLTPLAHDDLDGVARAAYIVALTAALARRQTIHDDLVRALASVENQQAWRWDIRVRVLEAVLSGGDRTVLWSPGSDHFSPLAALELADLIGGSLHFVDPVPPFLVQSIRRFPDRWRPVLLRQLTQPRNPSAPVAARLLMEYGSREDAAHLDAFERSGPAGGRKASLSRALVRRVSPTLRIHDLGRTTYEILGAETAASGARRKALALLLYLVTRPRQTSTREQMMEELWPNQSPSAATNSLHQTLHFIRREIAPWHDGGVAPEYVPLDAELIYLDPELVQVDSVSFMRQATDALGSPDVSRRGPAILRLYSGRFAPEFEYEDWASDWRTLLHAQFLHLSHATAASLLATNRIQPAIEVLTNAVELDGLAFEIRSMLIRTLTRAGALDAATDHYRHYVNLMRRELGVRAPPLDALLKEGD
jgi:ATP/maltotriose-dependent transcriptional regulator MalT